MARIIGKDALPARQRLTLAAAELVNDAFLRQSAFSEVDRYCGPERQACMLRLLVHFIELAENAAGLGVTPEQITALDVMRPLTRMGEEIGESELARFAALERRVEEAFATLAVPATAPAAATEDAHAA
jgi:V/A-type H+-transporting ATPase subunit A